MTDAEILAAILRKTCARELRLLAFQGSTIVTIPVPQLMKEQNN